MKALATCVVMVLLALPWVLPGHTESLFSVAGGGTAQLAWATASPINWAWNAGLATPPPNVVAGGNPVQAVANAFGSVGGASGLNFVNAGSSALASVATDGTNLVTFASTPQNLAAVGGAVAITIFTFNTTNYRILEADIAFNPAVTFSTLGTAAAMDIESVAAHEVGHFVGQKHSPVCHATMFPFSAVGSTSGRTLSEDDRGGLRTIYPGATVPNFGQVNFSVVRPGGLPVFGAHAVLQCLATGATISGAVSLPNGTVQVKSVPPGIYSLYVEPLDGPFPSSSLSGGLWSSAAMDTTFSTTIYGSLSAPTPVVVKPGVTTSVPTLTVSTVTPINVSGLALTAIPNGFASYTALAATTAAPYSQYLVIGGPQFHTLPDSAFSLPGPFLSIIGASTALGSFMGGDGWKIFPVSVASTTPTGGYSVRVVNPTTGAISYFTAGLDVQNPTPQAYTAPYLPACVGSAGPLSLSSAVAPTIGNGSFALTLGGTGGGQVGYYLLSGRPDALLVRPACYVAMDLTTLVLPLPGIPVPLSMGTTIIPSPIPNQAGLSGADVYLQIVATDPMAPSGVALSNGLRVHLQ